MLRVLPLMLRLLLLLMLLLLLQLLLLLLPPWVFAHDAGYWQEIEQAMLAVRATRKGRNKAAASARFRSAMLSRQGRLSWTFGPRPSWLISTAGYLCSTVVSTAKR